MPGGFTPNGSVRWFVEADRKDKETQQGNGKYRLEGKDEIGKEHYFKVTIRLPSIQENRDQVLDQLTPQLDAARRGPGELTFFMPVEDVSSGYNPGEGRNPSGSDNLAAPLNADQWQIYVDWSPKKSELPSHLQKWKSPGGNLV